MNDTAPISWTSEHGDPVPDDMAGLTPQGFDQILGKHLGPVAGLVAEQQTRLGAHDTRLGVHDERLGLNERAIKDLTKAQIQQGERIKQLTGDNLGGFALRFGLAVIAFAVAMAIALSDSSFWRSAGWGLVFGIITFAVVGLVQLHMPLVQKSKNSTKDEAPADSENT